MDGVQLDRADQSPADFFHVNDMTVVLAVGGRVRVKSGVTAGRITLAGDGINPFIIVIRVIRALAPTSTGSFWFSPPFPMACHAVTLVTGLLFMALLPVFHGVQPGGEFLPGPQEKLQADYKRELNEKYGVNFNWLFTMTNAPIGRFKKYLQANGRLQQYLQLLAGNFNPDAVENIMCRNLVSVDYRGILYNCDFNQALDLPITDAAGNNITIEQLEDVLLGDLDIITGEHCFCCTAGDGSSCTGALTK